MTATDSRPPASEQSGNRVFPVSVYLLYPEGDGLQHGGVALLSGNRLTFDHYTVRKGGKGGKDDLGHVLADVMQAILRTAPGRPIRYVLKTVNAREYSGVREVLEQELRARGVENLQYGSSFMQTEVLRLASLHAQHNHDWKDMHNNVHSYVSTIGNGEHNFTSIVSASPRHLRWTEGHSEGHDPVAANFTAIRDSLVGLGERSGVAVWSSSKAVEELLTGKKSAILSSDAAASARELNNYRKGRSLELTYNSLAAPYLIRLSTYLCLRQYEQYVFDQTRGPADSSKKGREQAR